MQCVLPPSLSSEANLVANLDTGHCRRRKIRCALAEGDPQGRCSNCIRLKKECIFTPVDTALPEGKPSVKGSKPSSVSTHSPSSVGASSLDVTDRETSRYLGATTTTGPEHHLTSEPMSAISASSTGKSFAPSNCSLSDRSTGSLNSSDNFPPGYGALSNLRTDWQSRSVSGPSSHYTDPQWRMHESPVLEQFGHVPSSAPGIVASSASYPYMQSREAQNMGPPMRSASWAEVDRSQHPYGQPYGQQQYSNPRQPAILYSQSYPHPSTPYQQGAQQLPYAQNVPSSFHGGHGSAQEQWAYQHQAYLASNRHDSAVPNWIHHQQMQGLDPQYANQGTKPGPQQPPRSRPD